MKHFGFTLAEVLITLGIIGVVAAMTLPTVISNGRKKEVETKLAKVYSVMNQAINLNIAEYGDYKNWIKDCGGSSNTKCSVDDVYNWYNQYLGKQIKATKVEKVSEPSLKGIYIYFADGSILFINNYIYDISYYTDKKAIKKPIPGRNQFTFRLNPYQLAHQLSINECESTLGKGFEPNSYKWDGTREGLIEGRNAGTAWACSPAGNKAYCAKLIQYNGWKIPDDYPIKF